jgi:hypothetical protein
MQGQEEVETMSRRRALVGVVCVGVVCVGLCAATLGSGATPAIAKEKESKRAVCSPAYAAYKAAVEREQAGRLREASELLGPCTQATACAGLLPKCRTLSEKLASALPTVVFEVTDRSGDDRVDVQVRMDGQILTPRLDGRSVAVEAGFHEFTFSTERGVFATRKVLVMEGQRNRPIGVSMVGAPAPSAPSSGPSADTAPETTASAAPAAETVAGSRAATEKLGLGRTDVPPEREGPPDRAPPRRGRPVLPYLLGGVGLAGLAAGGLLSYWGAQDNKTLETQCSPHCQPAALDHVRTIYVAADVAFAVGGLGLVTATWVFLHPPAAESTTVSTIAIDVHPMASGGFASVSGAF